MSLIVGAICPVGTTLIYDEDTIRPYTRGYHFCKYIRDVFKHYPPHLRSDFVFGLIEIPAGATVKSCNEVSVTDKFTLIELLDGDITDSIDGKTYRFKDGKLIS